MTIKKRQFEEFQTWKQFFLLPGTIKPAAAGRIAPSRLAVGSDGKL
jgi:hypothetical protein